jgi:hypothetical protein
MISIHALIHKPTVAAIMAGPADSRSTEDEDEVISIHILIHELAPSHARHAQFGGSGAL